MGGRSANRYLGILGWCFLLLSALPIFIVMLSTCTQGSDDAWLASLILSLPLFLVGVVVCFANPIQHNLVNGIQRILIPLLIANLWISMEYLVAVTLNELQLCTVAMGDTGFDAYPRSWWARYWAPIHLFMSVMVVGVIVYQRNIREGDNDAH